MLIKKKSTINSDSKTQKDAVLRAEESIEEFSNFIKYTVHRINPRNPSFDSDDIAQEVKLKLWKIFKSEKKIKLPSSYIRKVVYSTAIDMIRKLKREKEVLSEFRLAVDEGEYPLKVPVSRQELEQTIGNAVDGLKEPRRKVVRLYLLGMDIIEIAEFYKWSKDKVRNLLYRGLNDLKMELKKKGLRFDNK